MPQCGHAARRSFRRPGREPRRLLPDLVRVRGLELGLLARLREAGHRGPRPPTSSRSGPAPSRARSAAGPGAPTRTTSSRLEDGRLPDPRRRRDASCSTPIAPSTSAASSSTPPSAASTSATSPRSSGPGSRRVPPGPLPRGHRAADRPGHRRVLPGGAAGAPAARRRPRARLADPGRPLRWRPLADRDGPALPGSEPHRRRVRAGLRRPRPGERAGAVLADRITIEHGDVTAIGHAGEFALAYFQYALHQLPDPVAALRSAWAALRAGGWLVALDWYLPTDPDELRSRHGELIAGTQLDELLGGTRLVTRAEALGWFADAAVPTPSSSTCRPAPRRSSRAARAAPGGVRLPVAPRRRQDRVRGTRPAPRPRSRRAAPPPDTDAPRSRTARRRWSRRRGTRGGGASRRATSTVPLPGRRRRPAGRRRPPWRPSAWYSLARGHAGYRAPARAAATSSAVGCPPDGDERVEDRDPPRRHPQPGRAKPVRVAVDHRAWTRSIHACFARPPAISRSRPCVTRSRPRLALARCSIRVATSVRRSRIAVTASTSRCQPSPAAGSGDVAAIVARRPSGATSRVASALGDVVVPEADLVRDLVELEVDAPEVLAGHVPVVVLGLERQVDELDEALLQGGGVAGRAGREGHRTTPVGGTRWIGCVVRLYVRLDTVQCAAMLRHKHGTASRRCPTARYRGPVIRHIAIDDATMRALERHETRAHAIPGREVRDLGHAVVLFDPRDADPFWNRMASVRWPADDAGFDRRLTEALALFAVARPAAARLAVAGARPAGDLADAARGARVPRHRRRARDGARRPGGRPPVRPGEPGRGVTLHAIRTAADAAPGDCDERRAGARGVVRGAARAAPRSWRRTCGGRSTTRGSCSSWCASTASPPRAPRRRRSTGSRTCRRSGRATRSAGAASPGWRRGTRWRSPAAGSARPRVPRRVLGQRARPPAVRAAGVRVHGRGAGPAARMTLWARLTWQATDPAALAASSRAGSAVAVAARRPGAPARGCWAWARPSSRSGRGSARDPATTRAPPAG